jgi:hypothetical protein
MFLLHANCASHERRLLAPVGFPSREIATGRGEARSPEQRHFCPLRAVTRLGDSPSKTCQDLETVGETAAVDIHSKSRPENAAEEYFVSQSVRQVIERGTCHDWIAGAEKGVPQPWTN